MIAPNGGTGERDGIPIWSGVGGLLRQRLSVNLCVDRKKGERGLKE